MQSRKGGKGRLGTCAGGSGVRGRFDAHVVPAQTGPQQPQHQADPSQRLHRLQPIPVEPQGHTTT